MAVNLTSGALPKIMTGKCTSIDLKPVLQLIHIDSRTYTIANKQWYWVVLSDGSYRHIGFISYEICISNKLQEGSIVQLTMFEVPSRFCTATGATINESYILVCDLNLLSTTCDIIGDPKPLPDNETPLVVRTSPTITHEGHAEEPPTSKQKPSTPTQKCSSHSPTQNKKRKLQSSNDDIISGFGKDVSKLVSMIVEKIIEDGLGACYKKLGTLEEGVSKIMTKLMMEKSKEVDAGFKKLETLEEDVSKLTKMMIEKNKGYDVGACYKKLETLEEDVSKLTKMMIEKNKGYDVGACYKKLETLEEDVSKLAKLVMEKSKEVVVGFNKLESLEEDVSKLTKMMMDKNKEDDMGACIEKLDKMGWGAEEPIYDTALLLFLKGADYRKLWLHLKPECCGKWVKIAGSIFGLLD